MKLLLLTAKIVKHVKNRFWRAAMTLNNNTKKIPDQQEVKDCASKEPNTLTKETRMGHIL